MWNLDKQRMNGRALVVNCTMETVRPSSSKRSVLTFKQCRHDQNVKPGQLKNDHVHSTGKLLLTKVEYKKQR